MAMAAAAMAGLGGNEPWDEPFRANHIAIEDAKMKRASWSKNKTTYHITHPPPSGQKQPKLVFQLHKASTVSRPVPAFNVVPSTALAPRIGRRSSRIVRSSTGLGQNDLIIFRAEEYEKMQGQETQDNLLTMDFDPLSSTREALGVICYAPGNTAEAPLKAATEICLGDGIVWKTQKLMSGAYEFILSERPGDRIDFPRIARWTARPMGADGKRRFGFAMIQPGVRQHPIVGFLEQGKITISDKAKIEQLRALILVSAIWVAIKEGWSSCFTYDPILNSFMQSQSTSSVSVAPSPAIPASRRPTSSPNLPYSLPPPGQQPQGSSPSSASRFVRQRVVQRVHSPPPDSECDSDEDGGLYDDVPDDKEELKPLKTTSAGPGPRSGMIRNGSVLSQEQEDLVPEARDLSRLEPKATNEGGSIVRRPSHGGGVGRALVGKLKAVGRALKLHSRRSR